jgi:transcriptional regulator with XRE-family HTH domain
MKKTNFDLYLEEQLKDPVFAERFEKAGEAWDVALQLTALREKAGLSQKELARKLHTSQQNISRLESPSYEGHSLARLRRVAEVLGATVHVTLATKEETEPMTLSEAKVAYKIRRK